MRTIIFFSHNLKKISEINKLFACTEINVSGLEGYNKINEPKENGKSFFENAKIKSKLGFEKFKLPCFADDSGLCIEALKGKPGIYSKRFFKKFQNKKETFKYIIKKTEEKQNNFAKFVTVICLTLRKDQHIFFKGEILGQISKKPKGSFGFGYDPIFIPKGLNKTLAEIAENSKNRISHRGEAVRKLIDFLSN